MQKLIRNREGNDAYESDDDDSKNPYASSVCFHYSLNKTQIYVTFRKSPRTKKRSFLQ